MARWSPSSFSCAGFATCWLIGIALAISSHPAESATRTEKAFGKWSVVCVEPENAAKTCSMMQSHVQPIKDSNKRALILRWSISINKDKEQTQALVVPTGISVKEGIRLFIGDAAPTVVAYTFCGPRVCLGSTPMDAKLAATIKASKKASANYVQGSKQLVQVTFDLNGFGEAYDFIVQQLS